MTMRRCRALIVAAMLLSMTAACAKPKPPVARPVPPPTAGTGGSTPLPPARPPEPIAESTIPSEPITSDPLVSSDIDAINKNSPFQPVFFALDQDMIDTTAQQSLTTNAELMKKYGTWIVTIEGHSDERGTAEYNLALGERRAVAARNFLVSLGIPAERLRTVSYGKEFPFDPGHDEAAWAKNRRAHFVVTSR